MFPLKTTFLSSVFFSIISPPRRILSSEVLRICLTQIVFFVVPEWRISIISLLNAGRSSYYGAEFVFGGGFSFIPPDNASLLILQLCSLPDSNKARNCWIPIVLATAWLIWYSRNGVIFKSMTWDENNLADLVQSKTFGWIKGISTFVVFSFGDWSQFPMLCSKET
ncbi:hypothetical protein SLA2020_042090 [Shorea laevis]